MSKGHIVPWVQLQDSPQFTDVQSALADGLRGIALGTASVYEVMEACDLARGNRLSKGNIMDETPVIGLVESEFKRIDTANYLTDIYREAAFADFGLSLCNDGNRGVFSHIYPGDITEFDAERILPALTYKEDEYSGKIVTLYLNGSELLDLMNNKELLARKEHCTDEKVLQVFFCSSGLKIEYAPYKALGSRVVSVKTSDGKELAKDKIYSVATYYIQDLERAGYVIDGASNRLAADIVKETILGEGTLKPVRDSRISLIWDVAE